MGALQNPARISTKHLLLFEGKSADMQCKHHLASKLNIFGHNLIPLILPLVAINSIRFWIREFEIPMVKVSVPLTCRLSIYNICDWEYFLKFYWWGAIFVAVYEMLFDIVQWSFCPDIKYFLILHYQGKIFVDGYKIFADIEIQ